MLNPKIPRRSSASFGLAPMLLLMLVVALSSIALTQTTVATGSIVGTVTDPSGAAVPNADITITDTDRGITYQTRS